MVELEEQRREKLRDVQELNRRANEVSKSIGDFDYNPDRGKFRSWLLTVSRYTMNRIHRARKKQVPGSGDTRTIQFLNNQPDDAERVDAFWEREYQGIIQRVQHSRGTPRQSPAEAGEGGYSALS